MNPTERRRRHLFGNVLIPNSGDDSMKSVVLLDRADIINPLEHTRNRSEDAEVYDYDGIPRWFVRDNDNVRIHDGFVQCRGEVLVDSMGNSYGLWREHGVPFGEPEPRDRDVDRFDHE